MREDVSCRADVWFSNARGSEQHPVKIWQQLKSQRHQSIVPIDEFGLSSSAFCDTNSFVMSAELKRSGLRPPSRHVESVEANGNRSRVDAYKSKTPGFGNRNANKTETSGLCDNREENGNVQLRQPQTRGFGFRKTVAVSKSMDVRSLSVVQNSKLPTPRGSQTSVNSGGMNRGPKTSSVPVISKSKRSEFERDYTRGSYRRIEEPSVTPAIKVWSEDKVLIKESKSVETETISETPKKKSLLSRFGFKSSSFRLKGGLFKNEQHPPSSSNPAVPSKASTLPQTLRAPNGDAKHEKSRSPVRKFSAKRFSFIDSSRNKCYDSRSSSFEIISDLSPDAMNAALKRPMRRPQTLPEVESHKKVREPQAESNNLSGPFLAMIISDGQCRLEQRVNEKMTVETVANVIYENESEYFRQITKPAGGTFVKSSVSVQASRESTPCSESLEIRPFVETDIDSHSSALDEIFETVQDYERSSPLLQDIETLSVASADIEPSLPQTVPEEWNSSKVYEPAPPVDCHSVSSSNASHSSRERDFLIDDEIIDQPSLMFSQTKGENAVAVVVEKRTIDFTLTGNKDERCEEINTPDGNDTLSACDSLKSESSLEAWFRFIESENGDIDFSLIEEETVSCLSQASLREEQKNLDMKCEMAPSNGIYEGVVSTSESSDGQDVQFYFGEDLTAMKMLLLRLRNMLIQAETCNPFEAKEKNGFYRQLALSDSRQNLSSLDSTANSSDIISALNEEILDLKRERVLLKEQLEEKDRLIKQLQTQLPRRNAPCNGEAKWQLPPSGRKVRSEKKQERCNVATQTDRMKLVIGNTPNQDRGEDIKETFSSDDKMLMIDDTERIEPDVMYIPMDEDRLSERCAKEIPARESKIPKSNCSLKVLPVEVHPAATGKFLGVSPLSRLSVNAK